MKIKKSLLVIMIAFATGATAQGSLAEASYNTILGILNTMVKPIEYYKKASSKKQEAVHYQLCEDRRTKAHEINLAITQSKDFNQCIQDVKQFMSDEKGQKVNCYSGHMDFSLNLKCHSTHRISFKECIRSARSNLTYGYAVEGSRIDDYINECDQIYQASKLELCQTQILFLLNPDKYYCDGNGNLGMCPTPDDGGYDCRGLNTKSILD